MEALVSYSLLEEVQETGRVFLLTVAIKLQLTWGIASNFGWY